MEVAQIHSGALRILAEMGMEIQNETLVRAIADAGFPVDFQAARVRFPAAMVERYIAEAPKTDWETIVPSLQVSAGVYQSLYHDPQTAELLEWNEDRLAFYFHLARQLPHITDADMLGCQLPVPGELEPLYERLYCWKYGATEGSSIYRDELCPFLLEIYRMRAAWLGKSVADVFLGTVFLVPPLKLAVHEANQVEFFRRQGLRVNIGSMHSLGGSAPVTLAGAVTLNLAEQLALRMVEWALFGVRRLHIGGSIAVMDMRTTYYRSAPVERGLACLMNAQLARFYGATFSAHGNLTDAKLPSVEVGMQKVLTALPVFLAGGNIWMPAGLLSADQICSPVQLVLDNELMGALKRYQHVFQVNDDTIGVETILQAGPGGYFYDKEQTARFMRSEIHQPAIWQRRMLQNWLGGERKLDVDLARDIVLQAEKDFSASRTVYLEKEQESELRKLIGMAERAGTK